MNNKVKILDDLCKGCELCVNTCPYSLFIMSKKINENGFNVAEWKEYFGMLNKPCKGCGDCYEVCPEGAIEIYEK